MDTCFQSKSSVSMSENPECMPLPLRCKDPLIYDTFHAVLPTAFSVDSDDGSGPLLTKLEVPLDASGKNEWLFELHEKELQPLYHRTHLPGAPNLKLAGYTTTNRYVIFSRVIIEDTAFAGLAFLIVFAMIWLHSGSVFVTCLSFVQILAALGFAYTWYMMIFWLPFFPFLNLVAIFIVIGIGADDVFVYVDHWRQSEKQISQTSYAKRVAWTLQHGGGAMLVTSLTTAAAFFANMMSPITSIRLFGLFCGLVVLCDFILMIVFIPAVVVVYELYIARFCRRVTDAHATIERFFTIPEWCTPWGWFNRVPSIKTAWLGTVTLVALCLGIVASQLEFASVRRFQVFPDNHPMEVYDQSMKWKFVQGGADESYHWPVIAFWGIDPQDNGNYLDPDNYGTAKWNEPLEISSKESQRWIADFCSEIRSQPW